MELPEVIRNLRFVDGVGNPSEGTACVMSAAVALIRIQRGEDMGNATDMLECVCPVVRRLAISINDRIENETDRKSWALGVIPRLIDSNKGLELTIKRAFACADFAMRTIAADAIQRLGLNEFSERIKSLPTIVDRTTASSASAAASSAAARAYAADASAAASIGLLDKILTIE